MRTLLLLPLLIAGVLVCARAESLSPLAERPAWAELEVFQETITRVDFVRLLDRVYAPREAHRGLIEIGETSATIVTRLGSPERFVLRFAARPEAAKPPPRFWRRRAELAPGDQPLAGLRIALDPGHLGGAWARMEERWFTLAGGTPVVEGELTLQVARHLAPRLTALGAEVLWVRQTPGPVTAQRPADFFPLARALLAAQGVTHPRETYRSLEEPGRGQTVQAQAEFLFYRQAEIRERARVVNTLLKPDLVLCLHLNAEAWGRPDQPAFVPQNHFHLLVNGAYSAGELRLDDQRFEMLRHLLGGITGEEHALARQVAGSMAARLALPPFIYHRNIAVRVGESPYVWARNLLANRLYQCPVVFLEPYVMNSAEIWARVQAGDYPGEQMVAGSLRPSLVREYADALAGALALPGVRTSP